METVYVTCAEMAALRGGSASAWRKRCAAGKIPGAFKKGKTWLIPVSWWWACVEIYPGSGRPGRRWAQRSWDAPDKPVLDDKGNEYVPCPFNMNGLVWGGPYASEKEAMDAIESAIVEDDRGYEYWAPDASDGDLYKESYVEGLRGQYQAAVEEAAELRAELDAARADITKLEKEAGDVRQQAIEDIAAAQRETDEERAQVISLAHEDAALREAIRRFLTAYDDTSLGLPAELDGFVALARLVGYKPINNTLQRLCPELVEPAPAALLAGDPDAGDRATETTCPACGEPTYPAFVGERWCEACQCLVNNTPEIGEAS